MTRLEFHMRLNDLITDFLENGGCPSWLSDTLRDVSKEVFEDDTLDQVAGPLGQEMR